MAINCAFWSLIWFGVTEQYGVHHWSPHWVAFLVSFGPVIVAQGPNSIEQFWLMYRPWTLYTEKKAHYLVA